MTGHPSRSSTITTVKALSGPVAGRVRGADKICEAASCQPSLSSQPLVEEFASELTGCDETTPRNDGRSCSDESDEEEVEWQPPESKEVSPNFEAQDRAPSSSPKPSGPVSDNPPPDTEVGETTGPQVITVDRANALQTLGLLPSGRGSSSGMPVVVEIPPGGPSHLTVRVVGVPATESHNDGRTFLQDGFGGLEARVQMESLGATELAVLYDFFDDNDIIGDFILTPPETPLIATELSSQLKNFNVKRALASNLSQFDSKQLALRTFGTVSLLRKVAAKYDRIKRKLAGGDGAASVIKLQQEVLRLKRDQQFQSSYWIDRKGGRSPEREKRCRGADAFGLRPAHGGARKGYFKSPQPSPDAQGGVGDGTGVPKGTCISMARPASPDGTFPPEWQTIITIMANDNLAFQAPPFVRMDPPQDEDDEETKESDPPAPDSFLDLSRGASTTKFRSKSSQLGKRASGSQSSKSHKKQAPDGVQELPSEWVGSTSPCRPEEVPLPLSPAQARASLADYPVVWEDLRRDVKLLMEDGLEYPAALALAGEDKCLHSSFPLDDLTIMLLSMMHWHRLDSAPWTKYVPRRYFTAALVALEGLRRTGTHIPEWRVTPGPSLDDGEIDLLESEDEAEDKAEKDEDYNPHQDQVDGVEDEDEIPYDASDDGVLNVAQRTTKRRRLSQSSAGVSTPKKIKTKSPVKTTIKVGSPGKSKSRSGSSKKPRPKSGVPDH
ncbi:unnamed protein product [Phytophthora fragariaefolia]|uniref:Unnamed protein product n=1 Tax=Phytophthora fragariaefolia TaxID=1490495 RepID=A0A9W6YAL3_9STRA|nr:unnamed protein product [Phytophthora fragariaefolia]